VHTEDARELVQLGVVRVKSLGGVTTTLRREGIGGDSEKGEVMVIWRVEGESKTRLLEGE
jgi:hypothetical protein